MSRARDLADLGNNASGLETLTVSDITDITATASELNKLDGLTATTDELNLVDGSVSGPLSHRNMVINGGMQVAQRGTSSTGLGGTDGYFTLDRYKKVFNSAGRVTSSQDSDAPNGFGNSLKLACTTADTSIGASEYFILQQKIEGQDLQAFAKGTSDAKAFMLSFYVKGNANATYVCELEDYDNLRQISKSFSVTTSWSRVELSFPADTTGAFDDDNSASLALNIWLHAGSTFTSGTINSSAWASNTNANRVGSGTTSFFDSTARTFYLTGVQLELGSVATPFEHRSYGEELARCQRYYYKIDSSHSQYLAGAVMRGTNTAYGFGRPHPVPMRSGPDFTQYNVKYYKGDISSSATLSPELGTYSWAPSGTASDSLSSVDGDAVMVYITGTGYVTFDAEL